MGLWLLMGGTAHALLRLSGERSDLGRVLDVIGMGMVIPMPPLWLCDMALIAADRFRLPELAVVNPTVQLWDLHAATSQRRIDHIDDHGADLRRGHRARTERREPGCDPSRLQPSCCPWSNLTCQACGPLGH
jgi:hypothetical protein